MPPLQIQDLSPIKSGLAEGAIPRVLIVDDNKIILELFCNILEDQYAVIDVATVKEALTALMYEHVDVVLLDFYLLGETSRAVADLSEQIGIPIVWMTGNPGSFDSAHVILAKPFNYREVLDALATARNGLAASHRNKD